MVEETVQNFEMNEVSADKAYLSKDNLRVAVENKVFLILPGKPIVESITKKAINFGISCFTIIV